MGCCWSCRCCACFLDSYLHLYIQDIRDLKASKDFNLSGKNDVVCRIDYNGWIQDSRVMKGDAGSIVIEEAIILENAHPMPPDDDGKPMPLIISVMDHDSITSDDFIGRCEIPVPTDFHMNQGGQYPLMSGSKEVGKIKVEQIHFIQQKLRRYTGPCKPCVSCCLYTG